MTKDNNSDFETLNKELIPLIHQYKKLQNTYIQAVNNGGCYININGNCAGDIIKNNSPYFNDPLHNNSIKNCYKRKQHWQQLCSNDNINSIHISKSNKNIIKKTMPIMKQLDSLNVLIIHKLEIMQKSVTKMKTFEEKNIYGETKRTLQRDINKLMGVRKKMTLISSKPDNSIIYKLNTNYLKYIFSLCLVIFCTAVLYYSLQTDNILMVETIIFFLILFIFRESIHYIFFEFIYNKFF